MVISGGAGTLLGPIVGAGLVVAVKTVVSGFIERWNFLLSAIFVAIDILMPGPSASTLATVAAGMAKTRARHQGGPGRRGGKAVSALTICGLCKSFGGLHVTSNVSLNVNRERRLIIGPNGAGKTTLFNLITGEDARLRLDPAPSRISRKMPGGARISAWRAPTRSSHCLRDTIIHNVTLALLVFRPRDGIR